MNFNILLYKYRKIITEPYLGCVRYKSSLELQKTHKYSHTVLLPTTTFPARSTKSGDIQEKSRFSELYEWQRKHLNGPEYVLHDGPPYANGDLHMGHAVNKIVKDINNRHQVLQGNRVHYVPGWDCHGLPIEHKALHKAKEMSKDNEPKDPLHIRQIARAFALETVEKQKKAFKSWGIMADWDKQCYLTIDSEYVSQQLMQFYKMYKSGLIFRALKPVYWSPSSRTALAEAELEYEPQFKSKAVYVAFPIENPPRALHDKLNGLPLSAIIWTTTPWTLVDNKAICYNPAMRYSLVSLASSPGKLFLVGSSLIEQLKNIFGTEIEKIIEFDGKELQGVTYRSRLAGGALPFLAAGHVTDGKGTGLVHTAPAHGPDDFQVALRHGMPVESKVDESGRYTGVDAGLDGLYVLGQGQEEVLKRISEDVLHSCVYTHSYPLDWRTKKPVILRATKQWFIDTAALKEKALAALDGVSILPPGHAAQSRHEFRTQLQRRPYWCISRQRAWGVPIPALYAGEDVIVDRRVIDNLIDLMGTRGPDAWWTCGVGQLLPPAVLDQYGLDLAQVTKGRDIMDIWLDSGLSWTTLDGRKADLYSEGIDQLTGWFQASLLTSIALKGEAPYKSMFVHGFVLDEKRRKMSKSIGNVIDPTTIVHGGKDKREQPAYGVDVLRWWVACHGTQHTQTTITRQQLDCCGGEIYKKRKLFKFLLGLTSELDKKDFHRKPALNYFDKYMVQECYDFLRQINEHYKAFHYNYVAQSVLFFINNKVSALYLHSVKDRLYCSRNGSDERVSAQLVAHTILVSLCKSLGPILPHLVEEVWQHHTLGEQPFYFSTDLPVLPLEPVDTSAMDVLLEMRKETIQYKDLNKYKAVVSLEPLLFDMLKVLDASVICEVLGPLSVSLTGDIGGNAGKRWRLEMVESDQNQCLRCWKYNAVDGSDICLRCDKVLSS